MSEQEVWDMVVANESALRFACKKFLPRSMRGDFDDLYSSVVYGRAHSIMRTYDPEKGATPIGHLIANVRWYAYKWVIKRSSAKARHASLEDHDGDPMNDDAAVSETRAEVYTLLDSIDELDAQLLRWKHVMGYSLKEIAAHLGVAVSAVKGMCRAALERAREQVTIADDEPGLDDIDDIDDATDGASGAQ